MTPMILMGSTTRPRLAALLVPIALALGTAGLAFAGPGAGFDPAGSRAAEAPAPADEDYVSESDPIEPLNRVVFEVNRQVLWYTARPLALMWRWVLPEPVRDGFRNGLDNLDSPLILGNQLLQGDAGAASRTFARMVLNSTLGVGGLVDVASRLGIRGRGTDMGLTFGSWGIYEGPYLVFPLLGPTTPRDAVGSFAQGSLDPFNLWVQNTDYAFYAFLVRLVLGNIDVYARRIDELDRIEESSVDFYASLRNLYVQKRRADVREIRADGNLLPTGINYELDYDLELDDSDEEPGAGAGSDPAAEERPRP